MARLVLPVAFWLGAWSGAQAHVHTHAVAGPLAPERIGVPQQTSIRLRGLGQERPEPVRIGLLISPDALGAQTRHGAELAVAEVNRDGGFKGRPFELVVRSVEGPWGSGSREIVGLAAEDGIWAMVGGLDGRTAHLAEQVVAKIQIPLVSPWASDPTLTRAFVPWFFRMVPDDRDQAAALADEIFRERRLRSVAAMIADSYDARMAASAFARVAEASGARSPLEVPLPTAPVRLDSLARELRGEPVDGIVIFGPYPHLDEIVGALRSAGVDRPLFAPLSIAAGLTRFGARSDRSDSTALSLTVVTPGHWEVPEGAAFSDLYERAYGTSPSAVAAYAYDGVGVIVEAIRRAGLDREGIRRALSSIDVQRGVTGRIRFAPNGNRLTRVELRTVPVGDDPPY